MQNQISEEEMTTLGHAGLLSPKDYRTVNVEHLAGIADASAIPPSFHIDYTQVPDVYQRKIGACTNHAFEAIAMKRQIRLNGTVKRFSPRFHYTLSKINDGVADLTEQGTYPMMPFKMAVKFGCATEDTIPNDTTLTFDQYIYNRQIANIPASAFDDADKNRIIPGYARVGYQGQMVTATQLQQALMMAPDGISFLMQVGNEFWTTADGRVTWASKDLLPIRKVVTATGAHEIVMTGWDTEAGTGRIKIYFRNSWSTDWCDQDNGWFYLDQHPIFEAWIVSEIPDALMAIIKSLPSADSFSHQWNANLNVGSTGDDVQALQIALKIIGTFPFNQPVTNYYGNITKAAVIAFQTEYNVASPAEIQAANGALGPKTRSALNSIFNRK